MPLKSPKGNLLLKSSKVKLPFKSHATKITPQSTIFQIMSMEREYHNNKTSNGNRSHEQLAIKLNGSSHNISH